MRLKPDPQITSAPTRIGVWEIPIYISTTIFLFPPNDFGLEPRDCFGMIVKPRYPKSVKSYDMRKLTIKVALAFVALFAFNNAYSQSYQQFKNEFLYRINLTRQKGCNCGVKYMPPAPPLTWNDNLEDAAKGHAKDMFNNDYFSHTSQDGRSMEDRIVFAGYAFKGFKSFAIGENIAEGQQSIAEVMDGWFKSEGHCKNLMNPEFKEVGVARNKDYWVQDFGGREEFSPEQQKLIKSGKYRMVRKDGLGHD